MAIREQPIKRVAFERGVTQQRFAVDTRIPYLVVHRTFNGFRAPTDEFIAKACRYLGLPEDALFDRGIEPVRVSQPINTGDARRSRALATRRRAANR